MQQLHRINYLLREFGKQHDIPDLQLDGDGSVGLQLKSGITVYFEVVEDKQRLFIYSPVIDIPPNPPARLALFDAILEMNFLESGGGGGTLAIFRAAGQVVYQISLDIDALDATRFGRALHEFLLQRENSVREVQRPRTPAVTANTTSLNSSGTASRLAALRRIERHPARNS